MKYLLAVSTILAISSSVLYLCPDTSQGKCGRCTSTNDPHITTFDDLFYDQHTEDCFQYVVQCPKASTFPVPFEICGCHYQCGAGATPPACIGDVTIRFFDSIGAETFNIEIDYTTLAPATNTLTGLALAVGLHHFDIPNGHTFEYNHPAGTSQHTFIIRGGGSPSFYGLISYQPGYLEVFLDEKYFQQENTCGLCGRFDGSKANDLTGSDGVIYLHPPIGWPISPADVNKINNFADTYLCEDSGKSHCYEIATQCCEKLWNILLQKNKWYNKIVSSDSIKEDWIKGCVADACALGNNELSQDCSNGNFKWAINIFENTAKRTYQ